MQKSDVVIRSAEKEDIPSIQHLLKETGLYWAPVDDHPVLYERQLEHDPQSIVVAEYNKQTIGMVLFTYSPFWTLVAHLAVLPNYQRTGVGELLFKEVIERVKRRGTGDIGGYVEETNEASLALCNSLGFETHPVKLVCCYKAFPQK